MKMKILMLAGEEFEDLELFYPYYRLREEGFEVEIASNKKELKGKRGYSIKVNKLFEEVNPEEYDALVLPGGRGPERIRIDKKAVEIVKHFFEKNKPVAAICHGPQLLISAGVVRGRKLTSWIGVRDDVMAAGGHWEDREVIVDGNLVTSRHPGDLHVWMKEFIKILKR